MSDKPFDAEPCNIRGQASATNGLTDATNGLSDMKNAPCNRPLKAAGRLSRNKEKSIATSWTFNVAPFDRTYLRTTGAACKMLQMTDTLCKCFKVTVNLF
jgi:hypothetical protein